MQKCRGRMVASSIFRIASESATLWKHSSAFIAETTMGRRKIALDPAEVERLAAQGLAEYQIAEALGISQDTLDRRKQDSEAIAEALQRGRGGARGAIENVAFRCAKKAEENPRYQTSLIFWLKTWAGWSERRLFEGLDLDMSLCTDEEL